MQSRMSAVLRATATFAVLAATRLTSRVPHAFSAVERCVRCKSMLAASNQYARNSRSPHFVMRPLTSCSFYYFPLGVRSRYAPTVPTEGALTEPWSNGQAEDQITKPKPVNRQMYGRPNLDLLRGHLPASA
jgi:hypothetical protein